MMAEWILLFAFSRLASGQQYLAVNWSSKTYGPDGPWNAITMDVGGSQGTGDIASQQTSVDLIAGSYYASFVPSSAACQPYDGSSQCGAGGEWTPAGTDSLVSKAKIWDAPSQINTTATIYPQAVTIGTAGNETTVYDVDLATMDYVSVTYPNGVTTGIELGFFALNAGAGQNQAWKPTNSSDTEDPWTVAGYLYNQSVIPSYSYGLQIGSASLGYPGSLYLGGYDKGRLIGPYTSFTGYIPKLLDIIIGVETGESPFSFTNKSGLLVSSASVAEPINAKIDPMPPGLHLPPQTCSALASTLPVYLDETTNYYLWNTSDPLYEKTVDSPAYLGFKFHPAPGGASGNVTVKVPFKLLNLTLTSPVVSSPLQYFPCHPFVLPSSADQYRLGRAFLQAAFFGYNGHTNIAWLAQAPGPGTANQGLGNLPRDIGDDAADLDVFADESLFAESWAGHWTVLNDNNSSATNPSSNGSSDSGSGSGSSSTSTSSSRQKNHSISAGAIAGATIGSIAGIALLGSLLLFLRRRKHSTSSSSKEMLQESSSSHDNHDDGGRRGYVPAELGSGGEITELSGGGNEVKELGGGDGGNEIKELDAVESEAHELEAR